MHVCYHLDCDGSVHRFTVLFEEQLQPLSGYSRLPATEQTDRHLCVIGPTPYSDRLPDPLALRLTQTRHDHGAHSPYATGINGERLAVRVHPHRVFKDRWAQGLLSADTEVQMMNINAHRHT